MLGYIPWNESALDRTSVLKSWIGLEVKFLTPEGWFPRGHDQLGGSRDKLGFWHHQITPGHFVWAPPPAAADVALEELRKARLKRQDSTHFFVCPRLLTPEWLKQLWKAADIIFQVPPGTPGWPLGMLEPLTIGIVFPYLPHRPWQFKGTPKMFYLARQVRKMFEDQDVDSGCFLCKFLLECRRLYAMPADVVRRMLFFRSGSELPRKSPRKQGGRKRKGTERQSKISKGVGQEASSCRRISYGT
jgi:hypothetical protein